MISNFEHVCFLLQLELIIFALHVKQSGLKANSDMSRYSLLLLFFNLLLSEIMAAKLVVTSHRGSFWDICVFIKFFVLLFQVSFSTYDIYCLNYHNEQFQDKKQKDVHYIITRVSYWGVVIGYWTQILLEAAILARVWAVILKLPLKWKWKDKVSIGTGTVKPL